MMVEGHQVVPTSAFVPVRQYRCTVCNNTYNGLPRPWCGQVIPPVGDPSVTVTTDPVTGLVTVILKPLLGGLFGG